ncbi:uncharacterized protein LOC113559887 [Rhopalosiphum maidis]|uniref:uncharacterized protein LOC113559887 n=1 Tax=Rhopalosiphum maidis TaxID=43146 RepID=UPI000F00645A|nr:uncharacterized protein LOC113559887 [Rhopalosiphum maidis]
MCIPINNGGAAAVPPAEYFRATQAAQRQPPHRRRRDERRQPRRLEDPSLTSTSTSTSEADNDNDDYDDEDNAKFEDATERALQTTAYCTCQEFHKARALEREREAANSEDMMIIVRMLIVVSIAILATKLITDAVYSSGASAFEVEGHDHSQFKCNVKRQLPPIEQGDTVIDSIFQIPINTLSAVGTLIKNVRPLVRRTRERFQQYYGTAPRQHRSVQQNNYSDGPEYYPIGRYSPQVQQNPGKYRTVYMVTPTKPTIKDTEFGKGSFKFE